MKRLLALLVVFGCGGPTHGQLTETPSAQAPRRPSLAPPASTSDEQRTDLVDSFDDMETTQRAYREAEAGNKAPPKAAQQPQPAVKKGVAEQAPPEPKKKGPAEQAPKE